MGRPAKNSVDFKARVVLSVLRGETTGAEEAWRHGVSVTVDWQVEGAVSRGRRQRIRVAGSQAVQRGFGEVLGHVAAFAVAVRPRSSRSNVVTADSPRSPVPPENYLYFPPMSNWSWGHFTDEARLAVLCAHEEAVAGRRDEVGVEHLVVGLLRQEGGLGARALGALGLTVERARAQLVEGPPGGVDVSPGELSLTRAAGGVLGNGLREALARGRTYVSTEHMLLGLVRDPGGDAERFLFAAGVDPGRVRAKVLCLMETEAGSEPEPDRGRNAESLALGRPRDVSLEPELLARFTHAAKAVVCFAEEESRALDDPEVDPEHLLLGLLRVGDGVAARTLDACGIVIEQVRAKLEQREGSPSETAEDKPPLSFLSRRALARAAGQAQPADIDTEHILLGIIGIRESAAPNLLAGLGVYLERIHEVCAAMTGTGQPPVRAVELARTEPVLTLEQHVTLGYKQATDEAHHIAQVRGDTHANLDDLVLGALLVDEGSPTGKGSRDRLLGGTWPVGGALVRDTEQLLGRSLDAGDLLLLLASAPGGIVATALSALRIDSDALAQAVEHARSAGARSELLWPAELVARNDEERAASEGATELERLAQPQDELRSQRIEAHRQVEETRGQVLEALRRRHDLGD